MIKYYIVLLLFLIFTFITSAFNNNNNNINNNNHYIKYNWYNKIETIQDGTKLIIKCNNINKNSKLLLNQQPIKSLINHTNKQIELDIPQYLSEYNFSIENLHDGQIETIPINFSPKPIIKYIYTIFNNNTLSVIINGEFLISATIRNNNQLNSNYNNNKIYINNIQCSDLSVFNNDNSLIRCTLINNIENHLQNQILNQYISKNNKISIQISKETTNEKLLYEFNDIPILIQPFGYKKDSVNDNLVYFNTSYFNSNWFLDSSINLTIYNEIDSILVNQQQLVSSPSYQCKFISNENSSILCNITTSITNDNNNNNNNHLAFSKAAIKISSIPITSKPIKYTPLLSSYYSYEINFNGNITTNKRINAGASLNSNFNIVFATLFLLIVYLF